MDACRREQIESAQGFAYDLSAELVKAGTLHEKRIDGKWCLFAPDWPGWPIVVDDATHALLSSFEIPSAVGGVLARLTGGGVRGGPPLGQWLDAVALLEEKGFLRTSPEELPFQPSMHQRQHHPRSVEAWLHLTNACNLTCGYCFVANKNAEAMPENVCDRIADTLARSAIAQRLDRVTLKFAGGEPTLAMPLVERFRSRFEAAVAGSGIHVHAALLSNGTNVTGRVLDFLQRPNSSISISLDGCGDVHDRHRRTKTGAPTWARIERNIDRLQGAGVTPFIMATISAETRQGLAELMRWVLSRGMRTRIGVVREPGPTVGDYTSYVRMMAESFDRMFSSLEAEDMRFDPRTAIQICELHFDQPAFGVACGIGISHLVVKPDGSVVRCPMAVDEPGVFAGDDLLQACRSAFPRGAENPDAQAEHAPCRSCQWKAVCAGGCPVNNERTCGSPFAPSPLCGFYRQIIPRYLDFFGRKLVQRENELQQSRGLDDDGPGQSAQDGGQPVESRAGDFRAFG